jgi:hypothetical protein
MTITNLRCDECDVLLPGLIPEAGVGRAGVRFSYHPGDPRMRDDSGVVCAQCWSGWTDWLGQPRPRVCAVCDTPLARTASLFVTRLGDGPADRQTWQLCAPHAAELLNRLSTVEPKFDPDAFQLPLARSEHEGVLDGSSR